MESAPTTPPPTAQKEEKNRETREEYFAGMHEASKEVHEYVDSLLQKKQASVPPGIFAILNALPRKRQTKNSLRSYLTTLSLEIDSLNGKENPDRIALAALSELNNYNAYLDNWILDNKQDVWNAGDPRKKISEITIASGIYREMIDETIASLTLPAEKKIKIVQILSGAMQDSYIGQAQDMEMSVEKLEEYLNDEAYISAYEQKSFLQSGRLYGASLEIGAVGAGAPNELAREMRIFGELFGTGLHISNDLGDFASFPDDTDFKSYQDQMADVRNGRLTLPIYYVLKHGTKKQKDVFRKTIGKGALSQNERQEISKVLIDSGAYDFCRKFIRGYHNAAKACVHQLPDSPVRDALSSAVSAIRTNKYLANIKK